MVEKLPFELLEQIFTLCDDYSLSMILPRVCRLFNTILDDNCNLWKKKCIPKYYRPDDTPKSAEQSWKRYYFIKYIRLFPVKGFYIGRTTHSELRAASTSTLNVGDYCVFDSLVLAASQQKIFDMILLPRNTALPTHWMELGIDWSMSYSETQEFLHKNTEDYFVAETPREISFKGRPYFSAKVTAIIREPKCSDYRISFTFGHNGEIVHGNLSGTSPVCFAFLAREARDSNRILNIEFALDHDNTMAVPEYYVSVALKNCRNLPKADLIGKIDPYVKFEVQGVTFKSSTKKTDYNPDYNENVGCPKPLPVGAIVNVEVWDWDSVGKDDKVAWTSFQVTPGFRPYQNIELTLKKGMKGHHGNSMITFDVVALRSPVGLSQIPGAVKPLFSDHSAAVLVPGHETEALVKIEFEKGRVDIKAYSLKEGKYVSLGYGLPNFEYKIRFQRFDNPEALGSTGLHAYSEAKLDDIPANFRLDMVKIYIADENRVQTTNLDKIASDHGWSGSLTYKDAKKTLRNILHDDKSETIYMPTADFVTKVDWDSKNVDFGAYLNATARDQSKIVEVVAAGHLKQTHTYFGEPKLIAGHSTPLTMKASVDDVKYGTPNEDIHIKVYQLSNVQTATFTQVIPVYV